MATPRRPAATATGGAAVRRVLPSATSTGERRARRRNRGQAREAGSGCAQAAGLDADSSTRHELTPHPPPHPHAHGALGGDPARPRRPGLGQVVHRRAEEPLGLRLHLVGDQPHRGRPSAAGRLQDPVPAGARDHAGASRALRRPRLGPLRREHHARGHRRRPQGLPLLLRHPDGRAPGLHGRGQGRQLPAHGEGERRRRRDRHGPLAQGAVLRPTTGRCSALWRRRAGSRTQDGRRARPPTSPPSSPRAS